MDLKRNVIAWVVAGLLVAGGLAAWGAWTARLGQRATQLSLQLETERQRNFAELIGHVQGIQGLLSKGIAAGTVSQNMLYMGEAYRRSSLATANFMALPLPGPLSASTGKFLNQVGGFTYSIARNEAAGRPMDAAQRKELKRLEEASAALTLDLQKIGSQATQSGFRWVGPPLRLADIFTGWRQTVPLARPGKPTQDQSPKSLLPGGMEQLGPQMDRMPVLIFDGPFSDHLKKRVPAMGGAAISEAEARRRALAFVPNANAYTVLRTTKRNGVPPAFSLQLGPGTADRTPAGIPRHTATVDITQAGGHLVALVNGRPAGPPKLGLSQARDIGRKYLAAHGFPNMDPTYGEAVDGFATVQYALKHRGVIVYPDQIKVRVALDNGEVVGVDARAYTMSHRDRGALETPAVSQAQARRVLNPDLKVSRVQLALIPTEAGDGEVLTYEFLGQIGNRAYLVYVNAKSGMEERILELLTTEHGTLAL